MAICDVRSSGGHTGSPPPLYQIPDFSFKRRFHHDAVFSLCPLLRKRRTERSFQAEAEKGPSSQRRGPSDGCNRSSVRENGDLQGEKPVFNRKTSRSGNAFLSCRKGGSPCKSWTYKGFIVLERRLFSNPSRVCLGGMGAEPPLNIKKG